MDIPEKFSVVKSFINFKDKIIYIFGFKVKIKRLLIMAVICWNSGWYMGTLYLDCYLIIFCNTNFFSIFLHPFLGFSCICPLSSVRYSFCENPQKESGELYILRSTLPIGSIWKKNNWKSRLPGIFFCDCGSDEQGGDRPPECDGKMCRG